MKPIHVYGDWMDNVEEEREDDERREGGRAEAEDD